MKLILYSVFTLTGMDSLSGEVPLPFSVFQMGQLLEERICSHRSKFFFLFFYYFFLFINFSKITETTHNTNNSYKRFM